MYNQQSWTEKERRDIPVLPANKVRMQRRRKRKMIRVLLKAGLFMIVVLLFVLAASFIKGLYPGAGVSQILQNITGSSKAGISSSQMKELRKEGDKYPERLLEALEHNEELLDFVMQYPQKIGTYADPIAVETDESRGIPLFLQWDAKWGYATYGDGCIGLDGCGPTCLSMVLVGLTGDTSYHPKAIADYSAQNGFLSDSSGTQWALMTEGAQSFGITAYEVSLGEQQMKRELQKGHPLICSMRPGDFTTTGHFIVIYKYEDGMFYVNDPNSRKRSEKGYSYERLENQIKAMWAYAY